jgi:hypothetical protein
MLLHFHTLHLFGLARITPMLLHYTAPNTYWDRLVNIGVLRLLPNSPIRLVSALEEVPKNNKLGIHLLRSTLSSETKAYYIWLYLLRSNFCPAVLHYKRLLSASAPTQFEWRHYS